MKAAKCFPTTKTYHFLSRATGELKRAAIYFPHSPFLIYEDHDHRRIVEDSGEFRFTSAQRFLHSLALGDIPANARQRGHPPSGVFDRTQRHGEPMKTIRKPKFPLEPNGLPSLERAAVLREVELRILRKELMRSLAHNVFQHEATRLERARVHRHVPKITIHDKDVILHTLEQRAVPLFTLLQRPLRPLALGF
jgi:hypothetical protein